jgi:hypothetical protein
MYRHHFGDASVRGWRSSSMKNRKRGICKSGTVGHENAHPHLLSPAMTSCSPAPATPWSFPLAPKGGSPPGNPEKCVSVLLRALAGRPDVPIEALHGPSRPGTDEGNSYAISAHMRTGYRSSLSPAARSWAHEPPGPDTSTSLVVSAAARGLVAKVLLAVDRCIGTRAPTGVSAPDSAARPRRRRPRPCNG